MRILYVVLALLMYVDTTAQEAWTQLTDIPEGGLYSESFVFQGNAYVVRFEFGNEAKDVYKFNQETGLFTQDFTIPIDFLAPFVLDNFIYFTQTDNGSVKLWQYDPALDELTQKNDVIDSFDILLGFSFISWVIDDKAYLFIPGNFESKSLLVYDTVNDTWIEKAPNPSSDTYAFQSFVQNGKAYIVFGANFKTDFSNDVWEYNPVDDVWLQKTDYPTNFRGATAAFTVDDYTYLGTGDSKGLQGYGSREIYRYHTEDDSWERIEDAGYATYGAFSFSLDGFGYFGAGRDFRIATDDNPDEFIDQTQVWRLDPQFLNVDAIDNIRISIFPNPVIDFIEISENVPTATFKIFGISGQLVSNGSISNTKINVSQLPSGIYFLEIDEPKKRQVFKFIKK